jgi:hypothetical protein
LKNPDSKRILIEISNLKKVRNKNKLEDIKIIDMSNGNFEKKKDKLNKNPLKEIDIGKIQMNRFFLFKIMTALEIVVVIFTLIALSLAIYLVSTGTFADLQETFVISEKRNFIYNFMSSISQNNLHVPLVKDAKGKDLYTTDFPFIPKTRKYTADQLSYFANPEDAFATFQKNEFWTKLNNVKPLTAVVNGSSIDRNISNFMPYQSPLTLNSSSNLFDMFNYINYLINKRTINYDDYKKISTNAYKLTEEYGLDFEVQDFISNTYTTFDIIIKALIYSLTFLSIIVLVNLTVSVKLMIIIVDYYNFSSLISVSAKHIERIAKFCEFYKLKTKFQGSKIKPFKAMSMQSKNMSIYVNIIWKAFIVTFVTSAFVFALITAQTVVLKDYTLNSINEAEEITNNVLKLDFIVAKGLVGLQDTTYPRKTYARIFYNRFLRFYKRIFIDTNSYLLSEHSFNFTADLCPILEEIKFQNCTSIYQGIFTQGYKALSLLILDDMTNYLTNKVLFYSIPNFDSFFQLTMGYLYATQKIENSFKLQFDQNVLNFKWLCIAFTVINASLIFAMMITFRQLLSEDLETSFENSIALLLHIKPNIMMINSKLIRILN